MNKLQTRQKIVASKDGTSIAFEKIGTGPVLILVEPALSDRSGSAKLAKHLAGKFTVISYDRRGRGKSMDTWCPPIAAMRQ